MKMWFPCEINGGNVWLAYTYQVLVLSYSIQNTDYANLNYFYWVNELTMQFDILATRFQAIPELVKSSINPSVDKILFENRLLIKYVEHHKKIYE